MEEIFEIVKAVNRLRDRVDSLASKIDFMSKSPSQQLSKKWLDTEDVCYILRISSRTLQKMRKEGTLPYIMVRRRILYRASDVEAYMSRVVSPDKENINIKINQKL